MLQNYLLGLRDKLHLDSSEYNRIITKSNPDNRASTNKNDSDAPSQTHKNKKSRMLKNQFDSIASYSQDLHIPKEVDL